MMKVQSQPAVSQNAAATGTTASAKTADAKPAAAPAPAAQNGNPTTDRLKDGFEAGSIKKPIIDIPNFPPKDTLSLKDHFTAGKLSETLSNPLDKPLLEQGNKDQKLTRDEKGVMRGPDGQPLAKVELKDGNTAYVDPNTNQYYLTDEKESPFRSMFGGSSVNAVGPLPLPEGSQFSNSYFSDADVRSIERDARGGGWINPGPFPHPFPFPRDPMPFPRDPGFPRDPIKVEPNILFAGASKPGGIEG